MGNRDQAQPDPKLGRGFHSAIADIEPERSFVVYAGHERYRLADATEAIGLAELCEAVKGQG